jgi:Flp pilus assembly protein protease CpaA
MKGEICIDILTLLLWIGSAAMLYVCATGGVSYVRNMRIGNRITASQSMIQLVVALIGLVALQVIHYHYVGS